MLFDLCVSKKTLHLSFDRKMMDSWDTQKIMKSYLITLLLTSKSILPKPQNFNNLLDFAKNLDLAEKYLETNHHEDKGDDKKRKKKEEQSNAKNLFKKALGATVQDNKKITPKQNKEKTENEKKQNDLFRKFFNKEPKENIKIPNLTPLTNIIILPGAL